MIESDKFHKIIRDNYELITENISELIFITNRRYEILYNNYIPVIKSLGYNKEELIGNSWLNYVYKEDLEIAINLLENCSEGFSNSVKLRMVHKNRDNKLFKFSCSQISRYTEKDSILIMLKDLTEIETQKRFKNLIKEHEKKFKNENINSPIETELLSESELRAIYDYTPLAIILLDNERRIRKINKFALKITGRQEEEVIGIHGGEALRCLNSLKDPRGCGYSQDCRECTIRNTVLDTFKNKRPHIDIEANLFLLPESEFEELYFLISTIPLNFNGEDLVLVSFIDITERKKTEMALQQSEARLRTAMESLPFDVFILNEDGYYVMQNTVCKNNWGDIVGKQPKDIVSDKNILAIWEDNNSRAFSGEIVSGEVNFEVNGVLKYYFNIITPIYIENQIKNIIGVNIDITDRIKAEEELKKLYDRLNKLASSGPAVIYTAKPSGDFGATFISDNVRDLTGFEPEDFINNSEFWIDHIHPDDKNLILKKLKSLKEEQSLGYEYRFKFKDGIYHWIRDESKLTYDERGKPLEMVGSLSDITWSKKSEEKLQYQAKLVENVSDAIISFDINFKIITWNKAAELIYGWKAEEVIGKKLKDIIPVKYPYDEKILVRKQVFEKGYWKGEVIQPKKDGSPLNLLASVSLIKDITGRVIGIVAINHDITDRKIAEGKLKESEEKFRNIAEQTSLGLIIQQNGYIKFANSAVADMSEYSLQKINSWSIEDLKKVTFVEDLPLIDSKLKIMRSDDFKYPEQFECRIITKSGKLKWLEIIAKPIIYLRKKAIFSSLVDITAKKKLEEELKEISRLKSELLSRTSHELKTPLVSIKGYADLLLTQHYENLDFYTISILYEIKQGCSRLESLIKDLLETSKLESGEIKLIKTEEDLAFLIRFCIKDLKGLIETRKHELILEINDEMMTFFEKERIYEVIINLLSNAIKYTPKNGKIIIRSEIQNRIYIISVQDSGIGLTDEEKEKIFKKFGKIERYGQGLDVVSEGSGLGLYISKKIIELHGGKMWVESDGRKKGSIFYFSLPILKNKK